MKFSIRDLLLVTVIVALALGWWTHQRRLKSSIEDERKLFKDALDARSIFEIDPNDYGMPSKFKRVWVKEGSPSDFGGYQAESTSSLLVERNPFAEPHD